VQAVKNTLTESESSCSVHTFGYGDDHNEELLKYLKTFVPIPVFSVCLCINIFYLAEPSMKLEMGCITTSKRMMVSNLYI